MNKSSFEQVLAQDGRLIYSRVGNSMWPLLRRKDDLLVIVPAEGRLRRFEVPLYRRRNGQLILHRVIKVRPADYVLCGDNGWSLEYGITDAQIIGKLNAVIRRGREHPLRGWRYRLYVFLWCRLFPLRVLFLKTLRMMKRVTR